MIPYSRQSIDQSDIDAVVAVLQSDFLTQGPAVTTFESQVAKRCSTLYAVAVNSATSALHIACLALGVGPGCRVWTSAITFVASANCALYCGATVDFIDIDPRTFNMCPAALASKLVEAERNGCLPHVVIPVHMCGQSCDMAEIRRLADHYGFRILEDASHAVGGKYRDRPIGDCRFSDISVFSFHPVKIITTAEGGLATTQNVELADRMRLLRGHGVTREARLMQRPSHGPWYYEQVELGFNYRMSDLQAALGSSQMRRLDASINRRLSLARRYDKLLASLPITTPWQDPQCQSALHLYIIRLHKERLPRGHREVFVALRSAGIGVNLHYMPVYLHPFYQALGFVAGLCPEAERYYDEAISLPLYPDLTEIEQDGVISALSESLA